MGGRGLWSAWLVQPRTSLAFRGVEGTPGCTDRQSEGAPQRRPAVCRPSHLLGTCTARGTGPALLSLQPSTHDPAASGALSPHSTLFLDVLCTSEFPQGPPHQASLPPAVSSSTPFPSVSCGMVPSLCPQYPAHSRPSLPGPSTRESGSPPGPTCNLLRVGHFEDAWLKNGDHTQALPSHSRRGLEEAHTAAEISRPSAADTSLTAGEELSIWQGKPRTASSG